MKLVVLGSGTSVPHARRASAAHWLETSAGSILLDASADAAHRMAEEQLDWPGLDALWISHFHLDHLGGLAPLLFGMKWAPQTQERKKILRQFEKRLLDEEAHIFYTLQWHRIIPHRARVKGWTVTPSHYLNNQLDTVWLD